MFRTHLISTDSPRVIKQKLQVELLATFLKLHEDQSEFKPVTSVYGVFLQYFLV